jgi:hypothetical protein
VSSFSLLNEPGQSPNQSIQYFFIVIYQGWPDFLTHGPSNIIKGKIQYDKTFAAAAAAAIATAINFKKNLILARLPN